MPNEHTTNDGFRSGGADRREPLILRSAAAEFLLTGIWNGGGTLSAFSPVTVGTPCLATSRYLEEPEVIFSLRVPTPVDRDNWGILLDPLEPGECGRVLMAGITAARFTPSGASARYVAPGPEGELVFAAESRARILCLPDEAGDNALALLSLAPPGRNLFYAGYFMLALHDAGTAGDHDFRVRVVDGATYDGETLASSADSLCKVNNLVFSVAPWESGSLTASRVVALRFTPGGQGTAAAVEVVLLSSLPDDGESAAYCQLGRVEVPDSGSNVPRIIQDHTAGVAHLWWFFQCR